MSLLLSMLLSVGACDCAEPAHYVDVHGNELRSVERCWPRLHAFHGEATPKRITIGYTPEGGSVFSTERDSITISTSEWATDPTPVVAHESSHLALSRLTRGASATEPFRFLDEGLAEYLEHAVAGDLDSYREEVLAVAAADRSRGVSSFAAMRGWSTYFGRPPRRNLRAYAAGASVIFHVVERFGEEKLRALLVELGRTRDLEESAHAALRLTVAEWEADWSAWLEPRQPAAKKPVTPVRIVRFSPLQGSKDVSTELREVEVELSADMFRRAPLCVRDACGDGLCYTQVYWKSPRVLAIRAPQGLRPETRYTLGLGVTGCQLETRAGEKLPVTEWSFRTRHGGK